MAESTAPTVGPLAALGPIGAIASFAELAFGGPSFSQQMTAFTQARQAMTPSQIHAEAQQMAADRALNTLAARGLRVPLQRPVARPLSQLSVPATKPATLPPAPAVFHAPQVVSNLLETAPKEANVGFLSGLGKVFSGVTSGLSDVRGIISAIHPAATAAGKAATVALDAGTSAAKAVGRTVAAHPVIAAAGAASAAAAGIGAMSMGGTGKAAAKAHLKNIAKGLGIHHKRMRVTNTKALHRALRRVKGFEHVARRVLRITMTKPHKVHFKFHRKRRAA